MSRAIGTPENPYRICVVCTGNICRSPMGEFILRELFDEAGLGDRVVVDSAGTTSWEAGNPADRRTIDALRRHGHPDLGWDDHVARVIEPSWIAERDLVLAADAGHQDDLLTAARSEDDRDRVRLFRSFDPDSDERGDLDMDDPWYGDDSAFDRTHAEIMAAAPGVVAYVKRQLGA